MFLNKWQNSMTKTTTIFTFSIIIVTLLLIRCNYISSKKDSPKNSKEAVDTKTEIIDFEAAYKTLVFEYKPEITTEEEFDNFKNKSNYIKVIEAYDAKNPSELFGGKKYADNISYYELPTEINTQKYANNSILFGDLNDDDKRDCIISVLRSDGYNEVTFFYVFINYGSSFKLEDVANEDDICGCKKEGWPHQFRYQKIEDGYLKGVSDCHYQDAHCCPSLTFRAKVKFTNGKLQFHSTEFVQDNAIQYRPTPVIDSVLIKKTH